MEMTETHIVRGTLRALLAPRRLVPIMVVSVPMVLIQGSYSSDRLAVPLGIAMCILFVLVAPVSWRILLPGEVATAQGLVRLFLYAATGTGVVLALGVAIPRLLGMSATFLTHPDTLLACLTLYLVGGWGLGHDIGRETILAHAEARTAALAREVERTQLLAIRSHPDPHFLFNALNAIAEWCREDGRVAEQAVLRLSSMLRCILDGVNVAAWPLERELELARDLFAMHLLRDPSLFELSIDVDPGLGR